MALEDIGLEDGNISESTSEMREAELQRIRDNGRKAKQVRGQIKKVQKQNKQFAQMLTLLLQIIDDEKLLGFVFAQLVDHHVAIPAIFAQFLPYLKTKIDIEIYKNMYGVLWDQLPREENIVNLIGWLKLVRGSSGTLGEIKEESYLEFILSYLNRYELIDLKGLDKEKRKELEEEVKKEMRTI